MERKYYFFVMLMLSIFLVSITSVSGQSYTEAEKYSREIGNKANALTITATYAATALMTYYQLFRTSSAITVDRVGIRCGAGTGSFTGYPLRIGLMNVNASGFLTTWCGATGDARATWYPTFSTWNNITLNQTASLADNTTYALVWQDYNGTGVLSATRRFYYYPVMVPNAGFMTVRGLNASVESLDCFATKTTAGVYSFAYSLAGWYIRDSTTSGFGPAAYQGVSFAVFTARVCYVQYSFNQSFYQYNTQTVDRFSLFVINNGLGAYHKDALHVDLYSPTNTKIFSGAVSNNQCHAAAGYAWYDYDMSTPLTLTPGRYWFKVWSICLSTTTGYTLASAALLDTASMCTLHQNFTYQGASYFLKTTSNNGTAWTNVKISDLVFKFRVCPTIISYENIVNTYGTHQSAYDRTNFLFKSWANFSTTFLLRENLNSYLSGTHQSRWNASTGILMGWANYTGPDLISRENIVNASIAHQSRYNSTTNKWMSWANGTSPLNFIMNISNAIVTHQNHWTGTQQDIFINGTGNGSGNPNLVVNENNKNVSGGYTTYYNPLTGWAVNTSYSGLNSITFFENLLNCYGTTESRWRGTNWDIFINQTSNNKVNENVVNASHSYTSVWNGTSWINNFTASGLLTPIHQFMTLVNATGNHDLIQNDTGYWDYATATGNETNIDLIVNENNSNVTGGYTTYYNPSTGWNVNNSYKGVTTPLHQISNFLNVFWTHNYVLNGTGYWDTASGTGYNTSLHLTLTNVNSTESNSTSYDPNTGWTVDVSSIGNTTPVTLHANNINSTLSLTKILRGSGWDVYGNSTAPLNFIMNISNAVVTHENHWTGTQQNIFINGTGNATGNTSLVVNENNKNVSGGYTTYYNPLTGWKVNNSYTGIITPVDLFELITNAHGTHSKTLTAAGWNVSAIYTGNTTGGSGNSTNLTINENLSNCTGSHPSFYNPITGWIVNNNYVGNTTNCSCDNLTAYFTDPPETQENAIIFHDKSIGNIVQKKWYINHMCVATNDSGGIFNYNRTFNLSNRYQIGFRVADNVNEDWVNQTLQIDRNLTLKKSAIGAGLNYVCYHQQAPTTASALASSFGVGTGSWIHSYNKTRHRWDGYWVGFAGVNFPVRTWDVVIIVVGANKTTRVNLTGDVTTNQSKSITAGYSYLAWSQWNESSSMQNMSTYGLLNGDWIFMYNTTARSWSSYWVGIVGDDTAITGYSCFVVNVAGGRTVHLGD